MDFKQIKELIKMINDSNIGEIKIEDKEFKISIRHQSFHKKISIAGGMAPVAGHIAPPAAATVEQETTPPAEAEPADNADDSDNANYVTVKSPMIGTFYRASSPDKPPYVKVGDNINKDDVLCIIEAMKLFNEIESEVSGRIVKVLIENESPVEYDQPLFLVDPNG